MEGYGDCRHDCDDEESYREDLVDGDHVHDDDDMLAFRTSPAAQRDPYYCQIPGHSFKSHTKLKQTVCHAVPYALCSNRSLLATP